MRTLRAVLVISILSVSVSACATVGKTSYHHTDTFEIVSMDTSICGKDGTLPVKGEMQLLGNRFDERPLIKFSMINPILGKDKIEFTSDLLVSGNYLAFRAFNYPLIGKVRWEDRSDGRYLIINFPADPHDSENQKGFDWVFKKK